MSKIIRDGMGRLISQITETENVDFIRDEHGHLKGQYLKTADKTLDEKGRYFGPWDQLLRLLE